MSRARTLAILLLLMNVGPAQPGPMDTRPVRPAEVSAQGISSFRIGSDETRFGPLEFVGGLRLRSSAPDFGGLSAFRFLTPGGAFMGVTDTGLWYFGKIMRDAKGIPVGVEQFRTMPILDAKGKPVGKKRYADAEGLDVKDGVATASFEREHRISEFRIDPEGMGAPLRDLDFLVPRGELRRNAGFETVVHAPGDSALAGARVAVAEKSLDRDGNIFTAILEGPHKGVFTVARRGEFDVTDGAFLPDGDLLLLERSFSMTRGVGMRLRRIGGDEIRPGRLADGDILLEVNMAYQIDNMEGLDVWRRDDGALMVSLVSDDNQSFLQRTLYLEFRMIEE